jgi:beta-glucosidase
MSSVFTGWQVLWAGVPGQEAGNAITDVLYGDWNPSGRLPYTIAKQLSDYSAQLILGGQPTDILSIPYTEGCVPSPRAIFLGAH